MSAQQLPTLSQQKGINSGRFANGISYYIVPNTSSKGYANFALIQKGIDNQEDARAALGIQCDIEDKPFDMSVLPSYITENIDKLLFLNERIATLTAEKEALVAEIQQKMVEANADSIDAGLVLFTRVAASKCSSFDSKRFKEENEDLYNKYLKESVRKESLKLTIRK